MPTGYTSFIENGSIDTAQDFLMLCARAFGACIEMRDEPLSKPIPMEFKPSTYYSEWVDMARSKLEKYQAMSIEEAEQKCELEYASERERRADYKKNAQDLLNRYNKILSGVKSWEPPTEHHQKLKEFAIEQIKMCLPDPEYYDHQDPPRRRDAQTYLQEEIDWCKQQIENYTKRQEKENARVAKNNQWLNELRDSLSDD